MTTIAALVGATPAAARGVPAGFVTANPGTWRHVVEIADPGTGSAVAWHDLTAPFAGYDYARGSDSYAGRYRASVVTLDLQSKSDVLAPWNPDTSPTFGVHVDLGAGLLIRSGFIRVDGGVVAEWLPRFTNKVETWKGSSYAHGKDRRHRITARDTLTSVVGVSLPARPSENWSDRIYNWLVDTGWPYGSLVYGAQFTSGGAPILTLPARDAVPDAVNDLDATCDPAGLVWYTNRLGQLVIRPRTDDTFHAAKFAAGATGDQLSGDVSPVTFAWWACDAGDEYTGAATYAFDTPGVEPFDVDDTERWVINHVRITSPSGTFDDDVPTSIARHDPHELQANWQAANDTVAAAILAGRANATAEARPLTTNIRLPGFLPGPAGADWLDYVAVDHRNADDGLTVTANGWVRDIRETVRPFGCDTDWSLVFTFDVYAVAASAGLLPVESLVVADLSDTDAELMWYNPAQTVTPTHTQVRLLDPASLWVTIPYSGDGTTESMVWSSLTPTTTYQFQVRLIVMTDGVITDYSPERSVTFTTLAATVPVHDDGTVTLPAPDDPALCLVGWELQQSGTGADPWATIDSGTVTIPPYVIDIDLSTEDPDSWYRVRSREVCALVPGPWVYSDIFPPDCLPVGRLLNPPYNDSHLKDYWPRICPDTITEAVSHDPATFGPAWDRIDFDGFGLPVMVSAGQGPLIYGTQPTAVSGGHDLTIACRINFTHQPVGTVRVFEFGGLAITATASGAGYKLHADCAEVGAGITTLSGPTVLALNTVHDVSIVHDVGPDNLTLYVNGSDESHALGTVGTRYNIGLFSVQAPAASWVTDCAVWDRALLATEVPGYVAAPAVTINQGGSQADPTAAAPIVFTIVFSEAVTGFTAADVTITGTATYSGGTPGLALTGSGANYAISVSGMNASGTVVATIGAAVCTSVATGVANVASTSTDHTVTFNYVPQSVAQWVAANPSAVAGYYPLDDAAVSGVMHDRKGSNPGTYGTVVSAGTIDGIAAANFSAITASGGQISFIPDAAVLDGVKGVFLVVRFTSLASANIFLQRRNPNDLTAERFQYFTNITPDQYVITNFGTPALTLTSPGFAIATTYTLAAAYDGTTLSLYKNGVSVASNSTGNPFPTSSADRIDVGAPSVGYASGQQHDGLMCELVLLTAASAANIAALHAAWIAESAPGPVVTSIAPQSGTTAGGQTVTITGTNLTGTTGVTFAGTAATSVTVVNSTTVTCVTPTHAAGTGNVVLTNPRGTSTLTAGYRWAPTSFTDNFTGGVDAAWAASGLNNGAGLTYVTNDVRCFPGDYAGVYLAPSATGYWCEVDVINTGNQPVIQLFPSHTALTVPPGLADVYGLCDLFGGTTPRVDANGTLVTGTAGSVSAPIRMRLEVYPESGKLRARILTGPAGGGTPTVLGATSLSAGTVAWPTAPVAVRIGSAAFTSAFDNFSCGPI